MVKIRVETKSGKPILDGEKSFSTVSEIYDSITKVNRKWNKDRIRLTTEEKIVLSQSDALKKLNLKDGDVLVFKDLGPQVSWKTVFFIEYFGPMLMHFIFYMFPTIWYGKSVTKSTFQTLGFWLAQLHFLKREFETEYVHRFSNATMPWTNLPKNCFHYHVLGGLFIAYPLYSPTATHFFGDIKNQTMLYCLIALWIFAQISNLATHIILRNLRPEGSTVRRIPKGYFFDLVSCPNYFFEILGWIIYSLITGSLASWGFTLIGAIQMYFWAVKKHQRYKKEFVKEYPKRKVLIPFLL